MNLDERDEVAVRFGVAPEQVERDHLISHLLAAISARFADRLHFIGGTALAPHPSRVRTSQRGRRSSRARQPRRARRRSGSGAPAGHCP
ncbi:hypothetical protein [Nocardia harenae]|uniref:hypothetical protein n=1 Tax=Nocardia harenae TaxID=358707 RepID=UPI000AE48AEC|nr:hypothetical protein [Nocardia harenae]